MTTKKKQAILKSAEHLFYNKGFDQTTVADIAKESGIHEASLYSYFSSKRIILFELVGHYLENTVQTLKEHFLGMVEPGPKLRKAIWHFLADMKQNPKYAKILMMVQKENPDFYASTYFKYLDEYVKIMLETIKAGQKEGLFRADAEPRFIRNMAVGTSLFTAFDHIIHNRPYDPHEHSDLIYQLIINAFGGEEAVPAKKTKTRLKEKRSEARKAQILATATKIFAKNGFSASTISKIAGHANLGDATLYGYFENKEAILMAISELHMQDLLADDDFMFKKASKTEKDLRILLWRWIWQLWTEQDFARILVLELFRNMNFYAGKGYQHFSAFFEKIEAVVRRGQKEGIFRETVPFPTYLNMIIGTIDQFFLPQLLLNRPAPGLSELNDIVDAFIRAISVKVNNKNS
jgi:TetR/AcrR family fatty acid metabolism transcriptional regulator